MPACKRILNENYQCVWYLWAQCSVPLLEDLTYGISSAILQWKWEFTVFLCDCYCKDTAILSIEILSITMVCEWYEIGSAFQCNMEKKKECDEEMWLIT